MQEVDRIGYVRISKVEQESENQIIQLKKNGVTVIFLDEGISGKKEAKKRPEFNRMLKYIEEHPSVKTIFVYDLSRIGRSMMDALTNFIEIEKKGVMIISLTEPWTQTTDQNIRPMLVAVVSWLNEQELVRLSNRVKAGIERARKEGKQIGQPVKYIDRAVVIELRKKGLSWTKIAAKFDIDPSTIHRKRLQWKEQDLGRRDYVPE